LVGRRKEEEGDTDRRRNEGVDTAEGESKHRREERERGEGRRK
jgi:hypothetical protein